MFYFGFWVGFNFRAFYGVMELDTELQRRRSEERPCSQVTEFLPTLPWLPDIVVSIYSGNLIKNIGEETAVLCR